MGNSSVSCQSDGISCSNPLQGGADEGPVIEDSFIAPPDGLLAEVEFRPGSSDQDAGMVAAAQPFLSDLDSCAQDGLTLSESPLGGEHPASELQCEYPQTAATSTPQWGAFTAPSEISELLGDSICAICLNELRYGAQTIAMCGHIFHKRCLGKWNGDLCPQCRQPIDEQIDQKGVPLLPNGTPVVLRGLLSQTELNGTCGEIVDYHEGLARYTFRETSGTLRLYSVKPENVLDISLE